MAAFRLLHFCRTVSAVSLRLSFRWLVRLVERRDRRCEGHFNDLRVGLGEGVLCGQAPVRPNGCVVDRLQTGNLGNEAFPERRGLVG